MLKRTIGLVTALVFSLSSLNMIVFAEGVTAQTIAPSIKVMTVEEAIKYAKENNKTIRDIKDTVDDYYDTYSQMKTDTRKVMNIKNKTDFEPTVTSVFNDEYALYKGYTLETYENYYNELKILKEITTQIVLYNVEKTIYDIAQSEKDLLYYTNTKKKLTKDLSIAKLMLKLKMVNNNQVNIASTAVYSMDSKIKILKDALVLKKNAFKALLGVDRTVTIKINLGRQEFKQYKEIDIEEIKKQAESNRLDILALKHSLRNKELDFKLHEEIVSKVKYDNYLDAKKSYEKAKTDYEKDLSDILLKVENEFESLITSEKEFNDALDTYSTSAETHRINKIKYKNGMISLVDLMTSELAIEKAGNDVFKAMNNHTLAVKLFEGSYTLGAFDEATPTLTRPPTSWDLDRRAVYTR